MKMLLLIVSFFGLLSSAVAQEGAPHIAVMDMEMGIFPGTAEYLKNVVEEAPTRGAKAIIVNLDTPGGLLQASQDMVKLLFESKIPVIIYVSPSGSTATSAGVFITMAAHVAAMAPGTTIGAAHPVQGDGKNIESDMRSKAENMTVAMAKSISEQRGRNAAWAEKAVKESASITEVEAAKIGVVDVVAKDAAELLKKISGKKVKIGDTVVELKNLADLPLIKYEMSFKNKVINTLADPSIVQVLWLAATTGLSIELYNPGLILPGVVGVICLILALAAYQVIPINLGGVLLLAVGSLLIGAELFVPSGVLAIGGVIALVLGSIYLIDTTQMPGIVVNISYIATVALVIGSAMAALTTAVVRSQKRKLATGSDALVGLIGKAAENISSKGRLFVNGEYWRATCRNGIIEKGAQAKIIAVNPGMILEVEKV
jgi:membrane-bound serine protease (ClpP class)